MRVGPFIEKQWGNRLSFLSGHCQFSLQHKGRGGGKVGCLFVERGCITRDHNSKRRDFFFFFLIRERGFVYVPGFCGAGGGCSRVRNLFISVLEI